MSPRFNEKEVKEVINLLPIKKYKEGLTFEEEGVMHSLSRLAYVAIKGGISFPSMVETQDWLESLGLIQKTSNDRFRLSELGRTFFIHTHYNLDKSYRRFEPNQMFLYLCDYVYKYRDMESVPFEESLEYICEGMEKAFVGMKNVEELKAKVRSYISRPKEERRDLYDHMDELINLEIRNKIDSYNSWDEHFEKLESCNYNLLEAVIKRCIDLQNDIEDAKIQEMKRVSSDDQFIEVVVVKYPSNKSTVQYTSFSEKRRAGFDRKGVEVPALLPDFKKKELSSQKQPLRRYAIPNKNNGTPKFRQLLSPTISPRMVVDLTERGDQNVSPYSPGFLVRGKTRFS